MKYMVIETHLSYAVVLAENGTFKKVANQNFEVGQMVNFVFEMQETKPSFFSSPKLMGAFSAVAAVAVLVVALLMNQLSLPSNAFASVILKINPEVRIDMNQEKEVVKIIGNNEDGKDLIVGYQFKNKQLDIVMDELVDLAIEKGYLYDGGEVNITFDGNDQQWLVNATQNMKEHVSVYLSDKVKATIIIGETITNKYEIVIPVEPGTFPDQDDVDSDYDDNDYGETPVEDSDYDSPTSPITPPVDDSPYDDSEYDAPSVPVTPPSDDSEYDDSDYEVDDSEYDD